MKDDIEIIVEVEKIPEQIEKLIGEMKGDEQLRLIIENWSDKRYLISVNYMRGRIKHG